MPIIKAHSYVHPKFARKSYAPVDQKGIAYDEDE